MTLLAVVGEMADRVILSAMVVVADYLRVPLRERAISDTHEGTKRWEVATHSVVFAGSCLIYIGFSFSGSIVYKYHLMKIRRGSSGCPRSLSRLRAALSRMQFRHYRL